MSEQDDRPLTSEEMPAPFEEVDETPVVSPGAQLTAGRRNQGLSLGDIARQLKISVRQVEALERDDYSGFSGSVFVRGFLRNYAKLLHLNPEELVAGAHSAALSDIEAPVAAQAFASGTSSERPRHFLVTGIILALVVLTIILLASNASRNRRESTTWSDMPALQGQSADSTIMQPAAPARVTHGTRPHVSAPRCQLHSAAARSSRSQSGISGCSGNCATLTGRGTLRQRAGSQAGGQRQRADTDQAGVRR